MRVFKKSVAAGWPAKCHFGTIWVYCGEHPGLTHNFWAVRRAMSFGRDRGHVRVGGGASSETRSGGGAAGGGSVQSCTPTAAACVCMGERGRGHVGCVCLASLNPPLDCGRRERCFGVQQTVGQGCIGRGGGGWHKASVSDCLPLAAPIGLSPLLILTLCGPERVLVVSTEPPDDLSCLTTPGVGCPGDGAVARAVDQGHPDAHSESMRGFADSSTDLCALGCASAG